MAWLNVKVAVDGNEVVAKFNSDNLVINLPVHFAVKAGDKVSVNGTTYSVKTAVDLNNRGEVLECALTTVKPEVKSTKK